MIGKPNSKENTTVVKKELEDLKKNILMEVEKLNIVISNDLNDTIDKKINESKSYKEEYVENKLKTIKDTRNNMRNKIENCEKDIKEIKENNLNEI